MVFVGRLDARTSAFLFQQIRTSGVSASLATVRKGGIGFDMELCCSCDCILSDFDGLLLMSVKRKKAAKTVKKIGDLNSADLSPDKQ